MPASHRVPACHACLQLEPSSRTYKWWQEQELRDVCEAVGLTNFRRARSNRFILFSVTKPGLPGQ